MIKAYLLKDKITNLEQIFLCRDDACDFEHSDTELHEGWFVTEDELADGYKNGYIEGHVDGYKRKAIKQEDVKDGFDWFLGRKKKEIL